MKGVMCSHTAGRCETTVAGRNHPISSRLIVRSIPHRCMPRSKSPVNTVRSVTCMALPSQVDGAATVTAPQRPSKDISVPTNLAPVSDLMKVPGGKGRAVELKAGQYFKITNTHGEQVVDFFGFGLPDVKKEVMSMHHSHDETHRLIPQVGDSMVTNLRRPIFTLLEDTGPGVHDTTVAACDQYLYQQQIGVEAAKEHDSCINNLHTSLTAIGHPLTDDPDNYLPPSPFNLWMAVSLKNEGSQLSWDPPAKGQKPGDYVLFRVEIDCVAVMSACPHDLAPYINGEGGPRDVHYQIFETA